MAAHKCPREDRPEVAVCGTCQRAWCFTCHPTPASLCPWCNGDEAGVKHSRAAIPPRQVRALFPRGF